jgi:hypothetical protein
MQKLGARLCGETNDGLFLLNFPVSELREAISLLGRFRRRPSLKGAWLKGAKARLAHEIIPYRPSLVEDGPQLD